MPLCGGSWVWLLITPVLAVHGAAVPVSKPGLPSSWAAVQVGEVGVALASLLCVLSPAALTAVTL